MYSSDMGDMFDISEARTALQAKRQELLAECDANAKLQRRFDQINSQIRGGAGSSSQVRSSLRSVLLFHSLTFHIGLPFISNLSSLFRTTLTTHTTLLSSYITHSTFFLTTSSLSLEGFGASYRASRRRFHRWEWWGRVRVWLSYRRKRRWRRGWRGRNEKWRKRVEWYVILSTSKHSQLIDWWILQCNKFRSTFSSYCM